MIHKLGRLWQWVRRGQRMMWIEYSLLALGILLPLLLPGYILTLDLVFTPHFSWPSELTNTYPLEALLCVLHLVLPGDVIEKCILFSILLFSGVGMHLLVLAVRTPRGVRVASWRVAAYFAGIFYMINPFTYSRFMAGQWMVLLGYTLLPFFVRSLVRCLTNPSRNSALGVALWAAAIITVSLHHVGIVFIIGAVAAVAGIVKYRHAVEKLRSVLGWLALAIGLAFVFCSYWLIPAVLGHGSITQSVASFSGLHAAAFATHGNGLGAVGEVLRLQGFWVEARDLYVLPQSFVPFWGVVFLLVWVLVVVGGVKAWRSHRLLVSSTVACILLGIILAASPLLTWLSQFVPMLAAYREPHKFASLIALGYAFLGAFGVAYTLGWARRKWGDTGQKSAVAACILLPFIITPTMLWGFGGQLAPHSYPAEWEEVNMVLNKTIPPGETVLFLPWHQYARFSFSGGRIIANPAEKFFEAPVIISDDPEYKGISPTTPNSYKRIIAEFVDHPKNPAKQLSRLQIKYVVLAKEQDWATYRYFDSTPGIRLVYENAKLKLYKVETK